MEDRTPEDRDDDVALDDGDVTGGHVHEVVPPPLDGERVDRVVSMITGLTRAAVATMMSAGRVLVDQKPAKKPGQKLREGQMLDIELPGPTDDLPLPEEGIAFDVVFADEHLVVVDKPAGLVVHPGAGNESGTLVNGLLHRFDDLVGTRPGDPVRPGIVHRLDAGTSGLLVVARTQATYEALVAMMKERSVERRYLALAWGDVQPDHGMIDAPIGRAEGDRTKMTVSAKGREARTRYEVLERHDDPSLSFVAAQLETGRTHQIRVHLAAIGHPVVGDARYGGARQGLTMVRPFLHARSLRFVHPVTGEELYFESPVPADLQAILDELGV